MDEHQHLIVDLRAGYKDITSEVVSVKRKGNLVMVRFRKSDHIFSYDANNLFISNEPRQVLQDVAVNGRLVFGAKEKVRFGNFLKIFFKKQRAAELHLGDYTLLDASITKTLGYFYLVAQRVKMLPPKEDEDQEKNTLVADGIARIEGVRVDSPLYAYLSGVLPDSVPFGGGLIFPFACNASQLKAVETVFSNPLSLIQGPPGTGKTRTILTILMNAILNKKRVAVVSNNNSAIQNVLEKLGAQELDFLAALLGRRENVQTFLNSQQDYPTWVREQPSITGEEAITKRGRVIILQARLKELFNAQNQVKAFEQELDALNREASHFDLCYPKATQMKGKPSLPATRIAAILAFYDARVRKEKEIGILHRWWNGVIRRWGNFTFWRQPLSEITIALKKTYYGQKRIELEAEIARLNALLASADFEALHAELNQLSLEILRKSIQETFGKREEVRRQFTSRDLYSEDFYREYPIILSTTFMVERFKPDGGFDLLIMDEASQVDVCTGLLSLSCAKQVVVVGDDKQLPCVITDDDVKELASLHAKIPISAAHRYRPGQSLLSSILGILPNVPNIILREHYRCDPLIIGFCNQRFYDNQLVVHTSSSTKRSPLRVLFTAPGNHARGHFNLRQLQEVQTLIRTLQAEGYSEAEIGLCTPYRKQAAAMGALTVHQFQGREKPVIILSTVDNQISSFVADDQLMNVAISRAQKIFCLIVSASNTQWENTIGDLINYIRYHTDTPEAIQQGKITSVFDNLYSASQRASASSVLFDSPAEELISGLLVKILAEQDVDHRYTFKMHIPLREVFKMTPELTSQEIDYLTNRNTHLDFLIYERFGRRPCFAIEVDGYAYHKRGTKQAVRDELKNSILEKNNFPLLRLSTIESNEAERIRTFLFHDR